MATVQETGQESEEQDVQGIEEDQISETKKRENRSIDDLLDKTYRELLIVLSKNII